MYYEAELGVAQYRRGDAFFDTSTGGVTNFGPAFDLGLYFVLSTVGIEGGPPIEISAGLENRASLSSDANGDSLGFVAPYPEIRIQLSKAFGGIGVTPIELSQQQGAYHFKHALAYMGEVGLLWAVTPKFSLGAVGSAQVVSSAGTLSPAPILEAVALLRFYFGTAGNGGGSENGSVEFHGWRYPFGQIR